MKLRSMVKTPLMVISHKNASIIRKQKSVGRQVRVVERSHDPSKKLPFTPRIKKTKISTIDAHSKMTSTQSGKMSKIKHSAAKRIPELKRAGRGKKSQSRNTKMAAANVFLTDLDSIISPTVTKNNSYKVVKAVQKSVKQKPVILNNVKPTSKKSLNSAGEVFKSVFSLINEIDSSKIGKKLAIAKLPVPQTKKRQSVVTKQPELYSNVVSVNSTSNFTATVFRKQSFQETQIQGNFSDTTKTSNASLELKKSAFVKGNITENTAPQPRTIKARNNTRFVLQNKQTRNKPEKRKVTRKNQVTKIEATTKFGRKQTKLLARKHKGAVSVVRNSRPLRSTSQKSPQSSKKQIPRKSSVAKKSKNRGDADEKKTAVVEVSEIPLDVRKRLQKMAKETSPVNKLSSLLTLKPLQTGKEEQFAGLTNTTAKKSVVRKQRKLTSEDHLLQNMSRRALKQYAPLLAIEVTPIQSLVKRSPKSATSSPTIVSSLCKAAKQTTLSQSNKNEDLKQREIMLPSENISRQSYSSKFTSTPILAYSSYRTEKASPLPTRKNVTSQLRKKFAMKQTKKNTVAAKMKKLFLKDETVTGLSISDNKNKLTQRKDMGKTHAAYSKTSVSVEYVLSPKQYAKKRNNSFISSVMNEASKSHDYTVGKNFHKPTSEVKVKKLPLPVLAKAVYNKSGKMPSGAYNRLQNNSINTPLRKNLRSSHNLNKDMKLAPTHKKKSVSYAVKRTQKQYQSKQKIKSKSYLHGTCNRPLRSPKNIPSIAAKVKSSQKSHKLSGNSSQTEYQNELLQRKRNLKIHSSLSSSAKKKNASLSNISISARSAAESVSQLTNVTDLALPSSIRKGVQRVSAVGKKTSRQSEDGKKRKPVTHARNVKRLSHINIEDNLELLKNVLSRAKLSKKSLSSVLNRSPKDFSRKEKSLISLRKRKPLLLGNVVNKPALRRAEKRESLPAVSVKTVTKNKKGNKTHSTYSVGKKHAAKYRVSNIHSDKNTQLGVKPKGRKPSSPAKQIIGTARIAKDAKFNLSHPEQMKALKTASKQKVTEISSFELQNLPKANKASNLTQSKTLSLKKGGKLSTKGDKRKSLTGMTTSLVKATEVQGNTMVIPRQTETIKPKTLINKVRQAASSPSQKKIITQSKEKVTKVVRGKMFASKNSPKLSTGGIKKSVRLTTRERRSLYKVAKVEMINWLTPEQNKALQLLPRKTLSQKARYVVSSQNLTAAKISVSKKHLELPKIIEGRKSSSQSQKQTRSAKTTESEKINLVSRGQKKSSEPSAVGYKIQRTRSSTSPKKMGKKKPNKVADKIQLNKVNSNLSKLAKATKLIVPSAHMIRLGKGKEIERIGLVTLGQKIPQKAPSHGGRKIAITKSSTLAKKKGKKALNKNKIIGKKLSHNVSLDRVKMRSAILSLPKIKGDGKAKEIANISLVLPGQNEESELSLSGYKIQKTKSSLAQKKTRRNKTTRKIDGEILSKQRTPKLSIKRTSVTSSPNISRFIKAKQIRLITSEQDGAPGKYNTQKTKIFSSSKKAGKKKKAINEKCKILSRKVNPKISTKMNRRKSVAVSPKITRLGRSKGIKAFLLASSGNKKATKLSPRGCKTQKTKLSAIPKGKEKKKTVKKSPRKIHPSKINSKVYVKIDASISSPTTGRSTSNKRRTYIRYSLVPQGLKKGTSKQLSGKQQNKKCRFTDVPKSSSLGIMPYVLAHTRGVKSTEGISTVSFQKTHSVYTLNKSHRKSQPSRNISTVLPFNLVNEYASSETSPLQLKRTTLMKTDIIYHRQAQHISTPTRKTTQASPAKLQHVNEELGRRSLLSSDTSLEWKMTVPLDAEIAGSGYRRKDKISLFPEKVRAESYISNVRYTRNDREDRLPVSRTTKSPQSLTKNANYSEQSKKVSTSKVSFSSLIDNADGHTRYIASTPFPVRGKSAVSSMRVDSARNSDSNVATISGSQPLLSYRHHVTRDLRLTDPVTSHMVSERENDEESVADSYTIDGYKVETEEKEKLYINREIEENEELEENTHMRDMYAEEAGKDDSGSLSPNSHAKQCIIS